MIEENALHEEHIARINKALVYIDENLDNELSLESIAEVAHYSPYHFHRIFKEVIDETLNAYITRRRIEIAASILIRKKEVSIAELSLQYGFTSNASFTRAFKKFYGISPSEFRKLSPSRYSKISKIYSKDGQVRAAFEKYICNIDNHKNWIKMNAKMEVKELPAYNMAYITHIGTQGLEHAFGKVMRWATPKGLLENPETKMARVFHDSFKVTAAEKVRMSVGMILPEPMKPEGEVAMMDIEKAKWIVGRFEIAMNDFEKSWNSMFVWMNENGYKKAERNPMEIYQNNPADHPENKFIVDLCVPVLEE